MATSSGSPPKSIKKTVVRPGVDVFPSSSASSSAERHGKVIVTAAVDESSSSGLASGLSRRVGATHVISSGRVTARVKRVHRRSAFRGSGIGGTVRGSHYRQGIQEWCESVRGWLSSVVADESVESGLGFFGGLFTRLRIVGRWLYVLALRRYRLGLDWLGPWSFASPPGLRGHPRFRDGIPRWSASAVCSRCGTASAYRSGFFVSPIGIPYMYGVCRTCGNASVFLPADSPVPSWCSSLPLRLGRDNRIHVFDISDGWRDITDNGDILKRRITEEQRKRRSSAQIRMARARARASEYAQYISGELAKSEERALIVQMILGDCSDGTSEGLSALMDNGIEVPVDVLCALRDRGIVFPEAYATAFPELEQEASHGTEESGEPVSGSADEDEESEEAIESYF